MLADYQLQGGEHVRAVENYIRGLSKDSLMNYARFNLSSAYNMLGKNNEALQVLKDVAAIDPGNERVYYKLGLLYFEMGNVDAAIASFQQGVERKAANVSLYYNYGLVLQQEGKLIDAEKILKKGYAIDPLATNINYALAYFYFKQGRRNDAIVHAMVLHQRDPRNPDYQSLFRALGIL